MKSIMKFIPAALALLTFASCSSDDLFGDSNKVSYKKALTAEITQLDDDYTRAGMVEKGTKAVQVWNEGDALLAYSEFLAQFDKLEQASGKDFTAADFVNKTNRNEELKWVGYPYENIKKIYRDTQDDAAKCVKVEVVINDEYTYGEKDLGTSGVAYVNKLPMWGSIEGENVTLKYLTGILRLDLRNIPVKTKVIEVSSNPIADDQPLAGQFIAELHTAGADGALVTLPMAGLDLTDADNAALRTTWEGNNVIDVILPGAAVGYDDINVKVEGDHDFGTYDDGVIYVPIRAGLYDNLTVTAYETDDKSDAGTEIASLNDVNFVPAADATKPVVKQIGYTFVKTIKEMDPVTDFIPGVVSDTLAAYTNAVNVLTVKALGKLYVTGGSAAQTRLNVIEVPAMDSKWTNIVLDFTEAGIKLDNSLKLRGAFAGKLTLKLGNLESTADPYGIEVDIPNADVVIEGVDQTINFVNVEHAKSTTIGNGTDLTEILTDFTIYDGVGVIETGSRVKNVLAKTDNKFAPTFGPDGVTVKGFVGKLNIEKNVGVAGTVTSGNFTINVIDGTIGDNDNPGIQADEVNQNVDIKSFGKAYIKNIALPGNKNNKFLQITSQLDAERTVAEQKTDLGLEGNVYTAAQLASLGTAAETATIVADELDLNDVVWNPITASGKKLVGFNYQYKAAAAADAFFTRSNANVIKNLNLGIDAATNRSGLLNSNVAEVKGIKIDGVKYDPTNNPKATTGVILAVTDKDCVFEGDSVINLNINAGTKAIATGGLIGALAGAGKNITIKNCVVSSVADATQACLTGHYFVGGLIGKVAKSAIVTITTSSTDIKAINVVSDGSITSSNAGSVGMFIGGSQSAGLKLTINGSSYGTTQIGTAARKQALYFERHAYNDEDYFGANPWIGCVNLEGVVAPSALSEFTVVNFYPGSTTKAFVYKYTSGLDGFEGTNNILTKECWSCDANFTVGATQYNVDGSAWTATGLHTIIYDGEGGAQVGNVRHSTKVQGYNIYSKVLYTSQTTDSYAEAGQE